MNEPPDKSMYWPLDVSITQLVAATFAPETGASELNRYLAGVPLTFR